MIRRLALCALTLGCGPEGAPPDTETLISALSQAPAPETAYGCDYDLAFEASTAPLAELMAANLVLTDAFSEEFGVGNFGVALRNPGVTFDQNAKLAVGESAPLLTLSADLYLRTTGGPTGDPTQEARILSVMKVSVPLALSLASSDGVPSFVPDLSTIQGADLAFEPLPDGGDPVAAHFAKFVELGGSAQTAQTLTGIFPDLMASQMQGQTLPAVELPIELPGAGGGAPWSLEVSQGGARMLLIQSDEPASCAATYGAAPAEDYMALSMPASALQGLLDSEVGALIAQEGPALNAVIVEQLGSADPPVVGIEDSNFVPDNPAITLTPEGMRIRVAEIPEVTTAKTWISQPLPDCDVAFDLTGTIDVDFALDLAAGEYITARATPSVSLSFLDSHFSNCWGVDSIQEDLWEGAVLSGAGGKLANAEGDATAAAAVHVRAAEAALEEGLNGLLKGINDVPGLIYSPHALSMNEEGFAMVGRLVADNAEISYAVHDLSEKAFKGPDGKSVNATPSTGVTCAPLVDCPDYDPRASHVWGAGNWQHDDDFAAKIGGASTGGFFDTLSPGSVLTGSGKTMLIRQQGTKAINWQGAHKTWPVVRTATATPKAWPFAMPPAWPDFEWVMQRPEVSLQLSATVSDYDVTVTTVQTPIGVKDGVIIDTTTKTVKKPKAYELSLVVAPNAGDYDANFVIESLSYEGGAVPKALSQTFEEDYVPGGDNTYVVHLVGSWVHADGEKVQVQESAELTLDGLVESSTESNSHEIHIPMQRDMGPLRFPLEHIHMRGLSDPRVTDPSPLWILGGLEQRWYFHGRLPRGVVASLGGLRLEARLVARDVVEVVVPAEAAARMRTRSALQDTTVSLLDSRGRAFARYPASVAQAEAYTLIERAFERAPERSARRSMER